MTPHNFVRVVRKWHIMRADPILRCLDDPEGLNNGYFPSRHGPQVSELANGLRIGSAVLSQELGGA
jgi:hypothetical protein